MIMDMSRSGDPSSEGSSTTPDSPHGRESSREGGLEGNPEGQKKGRLWTLDFQTYCYQYCMLNVFLFVSPAVGCCGQQILILEETGKAPCLES